MWAFSPVTRKVDGKKNYNRKKTSRNRYDEYGREVFMYICVGAALYCSQSKMRQDVGWIFRSGKVEWKEAMQRIVD